MGSAQKGPLKFDRSGAFLRESETKLPNQDLVGRLLEPECYIKAK